MYPVIVCIAKLESFYIEEFVKYHLHLGFKHIYIYDNEDVPTYNILLNQYKSNTTVVHLPNNNYQKGVQYIALDHFIKNYLCKTKITHVAHIDIDEFIVLKKHNNICDFIHDYIKDDCQGIAMNWRFFGSSGKTEKTDEPVTLRFTMCQEKGNIHIKTLFKKDHFLCFNTVHDVILNKGYIKNTNNKIVIGPFNDDISFDMIQLNHYKCKTFPEFKYIRSRGRADLNYNFNENIEESFIVYDRNEVEECTACNFYKNISYRSVKS